MSKPSREGQDAMQALVDAMLGNLPHIHGSGGVISSDGSIGAVPQI